MIRHLIHGHTRPRRQTLRILHRQGVSQLPKTPCDFQGIDLPIPPPSLFVAGLVQLPMMPSTKWHSELIAHFESNCSRLRKSKMMRIGWLPPTEYARL